MSVKSFVVFLKSHLKADPSAIAPERADPELAMALLRPLLALYQGKKGARIRALAYDPEQGQRVDEALEKWAQSLAKAPPPLPPLAQRVLLERVHQMVLAAQAARAIGETLVVPPALLSVRKREVAAALLWIHGMTLPYPVGSITIH